MIHHPKISVVGAGGNVGSAVVQWCAQKELGKLQLIDLKPKMAEGRALDLAQAGSFGGFYPQYSVSENAEDVVDSDIVVLTAGVPRKPGQTREELVGINAKIVKNVCEKVKKFAPNAILIVVSNPLDAMLSVAQKVTGFPRERVIGMSGVLDSSRFRNNIARVVGAHVNDVSAIVMGAHTDKDMVPITSTATVGGVPLANLLSAEQLTDVVNRTKRGGAELTELIGTSAWIAPGRGVTTMIESIVLNQGRVLPCSVALNGEYGITDCCLCVPAQLTAKGAEKIYQVPLSSDEQNAFQAAYAAVSEIRKVALDSIA